MFDRKNNLVKQLWKNVDTVGYVILDKTKTQERQ